MQAHQKPFERRVLDDRHETLRHRPRLKMQGMAIIASLLLVALIASLVAQLFAAQTQRVDMAQAATQRLEREQVLQLQLDWARATLLEDLRRTAWDDRTEIWAQTTLPARMKLDHIDTAGRIDDLQGRFNLRLLVSAEFTPDPVQVGILAQLVVFLGLSPSIVDPIVDTLVRRYQRLGEGPRVWPELVPWARLGQDMGLDSQTIIALEPHVTLLPGRTSINVNTASAEVLAAHLPGLSLARAQRLQADLVRLPVRSPAELALRLPDNPIDPIFELLGTSSQFFVVEIMIRDDAGRQGIRAMIRRDPMGQTRLLWQEPLG